MPKSKRNKQVELSKTKKQGIDGKKHLYEEIRSCADTYAHLFIFSVNDMRNAKMKNVRDQWKHSRFFIGKNKVMAMALGPTKEGEYKPNLHQVGTRLIGQRGLLFSNQPVDEVLKWFCSYSEGDYARSGNTATEAVSLSEGPLPQFAHSLESYLRQLGLPTTLKKGVVHLVKDHVVCEVGDQLSPETARILKLLGYEMAEFQIKIECVWSQDGSFLDYMSDSKKNMKENNSASFKKDSVEISSDGAGSDFEMEVAEDSNENVTDINARVEASVDAVKSCNSEPKADEGKKKSVKQKKLESDTEHSNESMKENAIPVESKNGIASDTELNTLESDAEQIAEEVDSDSNAEEVDSDSKVKVSALKQKAEKRKKESNSNARVIEETLDSASILKLTKEKVKESDVPRPKYSPKMTRARAAAAAKKDNSQTSEKKTKPVKRLTRGKKV